MKVSYKEFTGELVKLESKKMVCGCGFTNSKTAYDISIYDKEKNVTYSFVNVSLSDMKFMGGAVSFGG